jgi:serine/threonine-protein kinase
MPSQSAPTPEPPARGAAGFPRRFGSRYTFLRELGAGGMGRLFLAVAGESGTRRLCAIKTLLADAHDPNAGDLRTRFRDEARLLVRLSHENLAYVFDAGVEAGERYLAMEYIPGKTLAELADHAAARGVSLTRGHAIFIALELLSALVYMHEFEDLNLVHRDISPSNVMVAFTGGVKLIDFGVAKWADQAARTQAGVQWGKTSHKSPEQHMGGHIDARSDLFSVGVLLWEMLAGRRLFPQDQMRPIHPAIPTPSTFNPEVPEELDALVARATAFRPGDRFQSAREFHKALASHLRASDARMSLAQLVTDLFAEDFAHQQAETRDGGDAEDGAARTPATQEPTEPAPMLARGASDLVGAVIDRRYEVRRLIGRGSMGWVYEGEHLGIGKRVAIKVANPFDRSPELTARLAIEAKAAGRIEHVNVASVTDCGTTESGALFIAMEYVEGQRLDTLVASTAPMPVERAMDLSIQIARALRAAHASGIVHRDLKPANVMVVNDPEGHDVIKVLDFGLAKITESIADQRAELSGPGSRPRGTGLTHPEIALGTPRYMAPEQIISGHPVDARADLYAQATIFYEMLTGRVPVEGTEPALVCRMKVGGETTPIADLRPDLSGPLAALIMRTLARNPLERPQTAAELEASLMALGGERRRVDRGRPSGTRTLRIKLPGFQARRTKLIAGVAVVVAAGAGTAVWGVRTETGTSAARAVLQPAEAARPHGSGTAVGTVEQGPPPAPLPSTGPVEIQEPERQTTPASAPPPAAPQAVAAVVRRRPAAPDPEAIRVALDAAAEAYQRADLLVSLRSARHAVNLGGGLEAHLAVARALLAMERFPEAEREYRLVLDRDPSNKSASAGLRLSQSRPVPDRTARP